MYFHFFRRQVLGSARETVNRPTFIPFDSVRRCSSSSRRRLMNSKRHRTACVWCGILFRLFRQVFGSAYWPRPALAASSCVVVLLTVRGRRLTHCSFRFLFFSSGFWLGLLNRHLAGLLASIGPLTMLATSLVVVLLTVSGTRLLIFSFRFSFFPLSDSRPGPRTVIRPTHIERPF